MSSMTVIESLDRAQTAFRMGDYSLSKRLLEKLLEREPENSVIHNLLGSVYEQEGEYAGAIKLFEKAITLRDDNIEAYNNLGVALKKKGATEKALEVFLHALKLNARRADVYYNLGNLYKDRNLHKNAVEYYQKALENDPSYVLAYNNLGTVLEKTGDYDAALRVYHKGLQYDLKNPRLHYNAGVIYKKKNRLKEAENEFILSLKNQPGYIPAKNNLALLLGQRREYERALALFQDILKRDPQNTEVRNNIGVILSEQNIPEEARKYYEKALAINPRYTKARFNLARLLKETGADDAALQEFMTILSQDPDHLDARYFAGNLLLEWGKFDEAEAHFRKILKKTPGHGEALRGVGRIYLKRMDIAGALKIKEEIYRYDPGWLDFSLDVALYYKEHNEAGKAEEEIRAFLSSHPHHVHAGVILADLLRAEGKYNEAITTLLAIPQPAKREPEILLMLVKIYKENGRQEDALELLNEVITAQGSSDEVKEVKNIGETLKLYEETIAEYEQEFKDQWEKNLKIYKETRSAPIKENIFAGDAILFEKSLRAEEDAVPIINIGGFEPVFEIREEEEEVKIEERDEVLHDQDDRPIPLPEEPPVTLVNLLEGEELYDESPLRDEVKRPRIKPQKRKREPEEPIYVNWEDEEPAGTKEKPVFVSRNVPRQEKAPVEHIVTHEFDGKALRELSGKMADAITALGETMKSTLLSNAMLAQQAKQVQPVIMFTQPPLEKTDFILNEALSPQPEEGIEDFETKKTEIDEDAVLRTGESHSDEVTLEESDERIENAEEPEEVVFTETAGGEASGEEDAVGKARDELKVFVENVRTRLGEEQTVEEQGASRKKPMKLLDYLSNMTNYLANERAFRSLENEMRIKVESVRQRLGGKTGLCERIERLFGPSSTFQPNGLSQEKLLSAFAFIKNLSCYVPDQRMGNIMRDKIDGILTKLRGMSFE